MYLKKYKKIIPFAKKLGFKEFDFITNYGLFAGDQNLFKTLKIFEVVDSIKNIKGDIIEFGVWNANTSLLIKKILDIKKIKKKIFLFDHFKGLQHYTKKDQNISRLFKKKYLGKKNNIKKIIKFFNFKNINIIDKDATKVTAKDFQNYKFSLAIFDMDLYLPTITTLNAIHKNITVNGKILFDEANKKLWDGEKKAMTEFFCKNKLKYKKIIISKKYQPDVILTKIK